jgi:hypothetical protein
MEFAPSLVKELHQKRDNWADQAKTRAETIFTLSMPLMGQPFRKNGPFVLTGRLPSNINQLLKYFT